MRDDSNLAPTSGQQFDELCLRVGHVAVSWSSAENSLDMLVAQIFQSVPDKPNEREIPKVFNRKVRYLRKAFNNAKVLQPFRDKGLRILEYLNAVAEQRHVVIHGVLLGHNTKYNAYEFSKLDLPGDKTKHFEGRVFVTLGALDAAAVNLVKADSDAMEIVEALDNVLFPEDKTDKDG